MLGLYIPPYLTRWFHEAARMLADHVPLRRHPIEFTPQPGIGAPVWRGRAPSGEECAASPPPSICSRRAHCGDLGL
jgi:hypothetical protein